MTVIPDRVLWERARAGDADAFGDLYDRHAVAVHAYCVWRLAAGERGEAEDLVSLVFLEAWRRRARLTIDTPTARPLLLGIATNVVRGHWRTRRRQRGALQRLQAPRSDEGHESTAAARIDAQERMRGLAGPLRGLPQRELEALVLVAVGELTYAETASALGVPVGTVRSRLSRARSRLADEPVRGQAWELLIPEVS